MRKSIYGACVNALLLLGTLPVEAQFNIGKAARGAMRVLRAATLTDADIAEYVREYIAQMDEHNHVCDAKSPYTRHLNRLTQGLASVKGIPLNFEVYYVTDVNIFTCPDGNVCVFSSLMDAMTGEEPLGVTRHELGHVTHKGSKKGSCTASLAPALRDGITSTNGATAALSESQLGSLGESLLNATCSQKQESKADGYGYKFPEKNGKNPWAMALAFEHLKKLEEDASAQKDNEWQRIFSSHPDLDKRIKTTSKRAEKDGFAHPENKMPEKIIHGESIITNQTSNAQSSNKRIVGSRLTAGKDVGKRPVDKRPVGKRPATARRR